MNPILSSAYHLRSVFDPDRAAQRVQWAVEKLRPYQPDVLVVTGISGTVLGARVAQQLPCKLAVVRRDGEVYKTHSGSAHAVEGWLGGRWVFFDDIVATGNTRRFALNTYAQACNAAGISHQLLGTYLHQDNLYIEGESL